MLSYSSLRVCMMSITFFCVPSWRSTLYTCSAARFMARNADSGYSAIATFALRNSSVVNNGVAPNSVMLARIGTCTASANWRYIASSVMASGNSMSAPASTYACARSIAASNPSTASASVRAITTKFGSVRASTAARILSTISSFDTIALFGRCPQRLAPI
ncbi:hypothetical protein D3C81_1796730 [compost metagenome]